MQNIRAGGDGDAGLLPVHFAGDARLHNAVHAEFEEVKILFGGNFPPEGVAAGPVGADGGLQNGFLERADAAAARGGHAIVGDVGFAKPWRIAAGSPIQVRRIHGLAERVERGDLGVFAGDDTIGVAGDELVGTDWNGNRCAGNGSATKIQRVIGRTRQISAV